MTHTTDKYRWVILALTLLSTAIGLSVAIAAFPLLNLWVRDLGISHTQGGLLAGLIYLPGLLIALPSGWLLDRYPLRQIFAGCWLLIVAGAAVMMGAPNFAVLCAGRLIFATGAAVHMVGAPKMLAAWFAGRKELGLVMGLYSMAMTVGAFGGLSMAGKLGHDYGWRAAMRGMTGLAFVGLLALLIGVRQPAQTNQSPSASSAPFRPLQTGATMWLMALGYFCFSIGSDSYLTFTPDYLVKRGYALDQASNMVASYALVSVVLKPLFAWFLNARNVAWFALSGCAFGIVSNALLWQTNLSPLLSSVLMGMALAFALPAFFALPTFRLAGERTGQAYGIFQFLYGFGVATQPTIGFTIDRTGGYGAGYVLMSIFFVVGIACAFLLRGEKHG